MLLATSYLLLATSYFALPTSHFVLPTCDAQDPTALHFAHFEYFGRPFAVAADLHAEHQSLLDDLLEPAYAQRYGEKLGRLVQKSFLRDVCQPDLACVACNALRPPNPWVTGWLNRLRMRSPFDDVRELAGAVHSHYYSVAKTGKLTTDGEGGERVASEAHMKVLLEELMKSGGDD